MDLLICIAGIMDTVREAVALLDAGQRSQGMDKLNQAIADIEVEIAGWGGTADLPLPREELLAELRKVQEELLAAREALAAPRS